MNNRTPVIIPVQPWYKDHSFSGRIVFAAVETMVLLAAKTLKKHADVNVRVMEDALFAKFLEIPETSETIPALFECDKKSNGRVQSKLLSQTQIGKMRRIKEHCELFFTTSSASFPPSPTLDRLEPPLSVHEIASEHIYHELVPFGPHYHTLQKKLLISDQGAWGKLKAPKLPFTDPVQEVIGSPFPLDGGMHAACVLGQQRVGYPPFPVGFSKRIIAKPTQPGAEYFVRVAPISHTAEEQVFDIVIFNVGGDIFETVQGLRMRDVTKALR